MSLRAILAVAPVLLASVSAALLLGSPPAGAADRWTWPVHGEVVTGYRNGEDPYAAGQHRGIDIAAEPGTAVVAATAGTVRFAGVAGSSGLTVSVRTADGRLDTSYLHLSAAAVGEGERVSAGDRIGAVGASGRRSSERPHLHFGVRDAGSRHAYHDPLGFLPPPGPPPAPEPRGAPAPVGAPVRVAPAPEPVGAPAPGHAPEPVRTPAGRRVRVPAGRRVRLPVGRRAPIPAAPRVPRGAPAPVPVSPGRARAGARAGGAARGKAAASAPAPLPAPGGAPGRAPAARVGGLARGSLAGGGAPDRRTPRDLAGEHPPGAPEAGGRGPDLGWTLACLGLLLAAACLGRPAGGAGASRPARGRALLRSLLGPLAGGR